jgi:hypothetical protein
MLGRTASLLALSTLAACVAKPPPAARAAPGADAAFARLGALVGNWEATTATGKTMRVSYRLVSNGSALVETYTTPSGKETLTIFHLDGGRLIATHYCAQKNQPRLALTKSDGARFELAFFDATNLPDPRASHLVRLGIALVDADHFEETEVYEEDGKEDRTVFAFRRAEAPKPAAPSG